MAQTACEYWREQGFQLSMKRAKSILRRTAVQILKIRFGEIPEGLSQQIDTIDDFNKLDALLDQTEKIARVDDLQL